ncbi:hypothetical protein EZV62_017290 [Acer yangbiense]|uniref:Uncharacterized protein n=1 Tax=Acer yangbiense TaxID=1000413 RepID=A0A5C7HG72_9ROSI|nr:hypothetical protein EZV62_017290 [Acer yangbiense]
MLFSHLKKWNPKRIFCFLSSDLEQKKSIAPPSPPLLGPPWIHYPDNLPEWFYSSNYPMTYTEKRSPTFLTTGNPCLDFFFHVVPNTPPRSLKHLLCSAWNHDPLTTLKLIFNLRGVRGTGKSDMDGFYTAALWLHQNHLKTLAANVGSIPRFGYLKDLPEILYQLVQGSDMRRKQKAELAKKKKNIKGAKEKPSREDRMMDRSSVPREIRVLESLRRDSMKKLESSRLRRVRRREMARNALDKYSDDQDYRFLFERISDYFAELLKNDMKFYESGELRKVSLAAKWCPSMDCTYDRVTLICESIAKKVFPRELYPEYEGIEEAHYSYRVRNRLRKQVLVPLRKVLESQEVSSAAMSLYKDKFLNARFTKYLEQVKAENPKIDAGEFLPHLIVKSLIKSLKHDCRYGSVQVAELHWKRMVDGLSKEGKLRNCMAVCDVSSSMKKTPFGVALVLGLLVSELSEDPWKGKLITFSEIPVLQTVKGDDLKSKIEFVQKTGWWGMNTNFQKVFDKILKIAVEENLKPEQMIKRLFVFSDMEFDKASAKPWETDYQAIVRKYTEKGYGSALPQIVFWNLRHSTATPVPRNQKGVVLLSGFSMNLLKLFFDSELDMDIDPEIAMEAAISGEEYQKLVVVD